MSFVFLIYMSCVYRKLEFVLGMSIITSILKSSSSLYLTDKLCCVVGSLGAGQPHPDLFSGRSIRRGKTREFTHTLYVCLYE